MPYKGKLFMSEKIKKESVDVFVHDISSPLLIVNLAAEELEEYLAKTDDQIKPEQLKKLVQMIGKNLKKVNDMITNFREIRRKERGLS